MSNWIADAEAALAGETRDEVEIVPTVRPRVLDATGTRGVTAPFLAAFFAAAALFQEQRTGLAFDPLAMALRVLAMAMGVRTVVLGRELWRRLNIANQRSRYGLALTDGGMLLRGPSGDMAIPKEDVLAIKERGNWDDRAGKHWNDVYVVTRPDSGRAYVALPPVFERTSGALAERLMRWCGVVAGPEGHEPPGPSELPSKVFDKAASGESAPGVTVVRHGSAWLRRGPYVTVLLGVAILDGFLRLPEQSREQVGGLAPGLIIFSLLFVPVVWAVLVRYDIAPRKGLALVLTPGEMVMRTRAGVHVVRWKNLESLKPASKRRWSLWQGPHEARSLAIARANADSISYLESFLGAPVEVVIALCDAYRKGILPGDTPTA